MTPQEFKALIAAAKAPGSRESIPALSACVIRAELFAELWEATSLMMNKPDLPRDCIDCILAKLEAVK